MAGKHIIGRLVLKEIEIETVYIRKVGKNNPTSGKVSLPRHLIGEDVYVVIKPKGDKP